ncbi:MAG: hypothetical protein AAF548_01320 [Actinomycetota bacterium]
MGLRDAFTTANTPDENEVITRVRLDDRTGELIISEWRGDELLSERREIPREY